MGFVDIPQAAVTTMEMQLKTQQLWKLLQKASAYPPNFGRHSKIPTHLFNKITTTIHNIKNLLLQLEAE